MPTMRYVHRNGHEELVDMSIPHDVLEQIRLNPRRLAPKPTTERPDDEELAEMVSDCVCDATDGCSVEPDGICPHGHVSWLLYLELI